MKQYDIKYAYHRRDSMDGFVKYLRQVYNGECEDKEIRARTIHDY